MSKLESLSLQKIRGASNQLVIQFDQDKKFTVIFGENGSGKSSIVDAFDFICNESFGSLSDKSFGGIKKGTFSCTIGSSSSDLNVELAYDTKKWTSKFLSGLIPKTQGPTGIPIAKILRREKLQEFLTKIPSERYKAVKSFIDTPGCDKLSSVIVSLQKNKKKEYEEAVRSLEQAKSALEKSWNEEGRKEGNYLTWARKEVSESIESLNKKNEEIKLIVRLCENLKTTFEKIEIEKSTYNTSKELLDLEKKELQISIESESTENSTELINVLESANIFFVKNTTVENCPVCEQSISPVEIKEQVIVRLKSLDKIIKIKKGIDEKERVLNEQGVILRRYQKDLVTDCFGIYKVLESSTLEEIKYLNLELKEYSLFGKEVEINKGNYELSLKFYDYVHLKVDLSSKEKENSKKINSYTFIKTQLDKVESNQENAKKLEVLNDKINKLNELVINSRNNYVESLLKSIESDIDNMYQKIHPNEQLGKLKLKADPSRRGSLEISATFWSNNEVLPQAYYSESHLDTLGICIFIGLGKLFTTTGIILILDDIVTSADQIHLNRFLKMLSDEVPNFEHTIIATHYQVWRDKYRYGGGNVQLIELMDWTIGRGIRHAKTKFYIDELKDFRNAEPMNKPIVASNAGIFLELILDNLALKYLCDLPRKHEPLYTLGEYFGCFSKRLKKNMKVEITDGTNVIETIELEEKLKVLPEDSLLRNKVGCHFNEVGANYSKEDIKEMADNTIALAEALICSDCGELPFRNRSGSYFECKCKKKRLFPLLEPN